MPKIWTRDKLLAALLKKKFDPDEHQPSDWVITEKEAEVRNKSIKEADEIIAQGVAAQLDYLISRGVSLDEIASEFVNFGKDPGPYDDGLSRCGSCQWEGETADCDPIKNLYERVSPGEPMPSGQCPECSGLCYIYEGE